jgi:hypothetical protein
VPVNRFGIACTNENVQRLPYLVLSRIGPHLSVLKKGTPARGQGSFAPLGGNEEG